MLFLDVFRRFGTKMRPMASESIVRNGCIKPALRDQCSVTASFLYELVEAILPRLTAPEPLTAAGNVPNYRGNVIETNRHNVPKLHHYRCMDGALSIITVPYLTTFSYPLKEGRLFVLRDRLGNDGIVFASRASKAAVKVLNASEKMSYKPSGVDRERCSHEMFNSNGKLVCTRVWKIDWRVVLWQ